jgi:hypothetical protein
MNPPWWAEAEAEADAAVKDFTAKLKKKLCDSPEKIIRRKNPFLFRVRAASNVQTLADMVINAYLSSSEETMFGNVLENVAIAICKNSKNGRKSGIRNIDLEYDCGDTRTIMQIKSGVNWSNASSKRAQAEAFKKATAVLRQGGGGLNVRCIEGICYGKSEIKDEGSHLRVVGHCFWKEISDWDGTADAVMELLGKHASNGLNSSREEARDQMVCFLRDSGAVRDDDTVQWDKLLDLVMAGPKK